MAGLPSFPRLLVVAGLLFQVSCSHADQTQGPPSPAPVPPTPPVTLIVSPVLDDGRLRVGGSLQMTLTTNVTIDAVR